MDLESIRTWLVLAKKSFAIRKYRNVGSDLNPNSRHMLNNSELFGIEAESFPYPQRGCYCDLAEMTSSDKSP